MASLATVSQGQQRENNSVVYPAWDEQNKVLSPWSDYRGHDKENGILSEKKEHVTDEEIAFDRQHTQFLISSNEGTTDFEAYLDEPQNCYQEGFLEKLSQLRMAHKKTLDSWQKLYEENLEKDKKTAAKLTPTSSSGGQYPVNKVDIEYGEEDPIENIHCGSGVPVDTYSNYPRKNPAPRRSKSSGSISNKTVKKNVKKNSLPEKTHFSQHPRYCYQSRKEESWKDLMAPARSVHYEPKTSTSNSANNVMKTGLPDKSDSDYFSNVNTELLDKYRYNEDGVDDGSWHHRLTVPEPFNMTKREEINQKKKKSRTLLEYEKECEEKRKFEEEECSKVFKASPVPDHVFMPLYEKIRRKDDIRRSVLKEQVKEYFLSQEKPFSFPRKDDVREELEEQYHKIQCAREEEMKKKTIFKANPIPKHILDPSIDEQLIDAANLREVKRKVRSFQLLKSASIPKGMEFRQKMMEEKSKARDSEKKKHNPKIHPTIPDYNALYKQFQKELMRKRKVKESTNVQPFTFRTSELVKQREKKKKESEELEYDSDVGSGRLRRSNSFPDHFHAIPTKTTTSTELRTQANRDRITKLKKNAANTEKIPKPKDNFLKKEIQLKISAYAHKNKNTRSTPKYREQQKNYTRQLQEMRERLEKRPLLFEQVEKNNVKNRVEKKFKETLTEFGLDESFVTEAMLSPKNRRPSFPRAISADYYNEDKELEVYGEKWEAIKSNIGESGNDKDSVQNHSTKSSHCDDNSPCPSDSGSEDTDNGQESSRSEF